jgi:hypothetical protein
LTLDVLDVSSRADGRGQVRFIYSIPYTSCAPFIYSIPYTSCAPARDTDATNTTSSQPHHHIHTVYKQDTSSQMNHPSPCAKPQPQPPTPPHQPFSLRAVASLSLSVTLGSLGPQYASRVSGPEFRSVYLRLATGATLAARPGTMVSIAQKL